MKLYKVTCVSTSLSLKPPVYDIAYVVDNNIEEASLRALDILKEKRGMLSGHVVEVNVLADLENDTSNCLVVRCDETVKKDKGLKFEG